MPLGPFKVEYIKPHIEVPQKMGFARKAILLNAPKEHLIPVAGISYRQADVDVALKILKKHPAKENRRAELIYEDNNKFDALAVAVYVVGEHVGYLPRKICKEYRTALNPNIPDGLTILPMFCPMIFIGGGIGEHIGIRLSLPNSLRASESRSRSVKVGKPKKRTVAVHYDPKMFEKA